MSLDGLLTLVGLLIALYQILPRDRRLELSLWVGAFNLFIVGISSAVVFYLQFYSTFSSFGLTPHLGLWKYGITPQNTSFLVVLGAIVTISAHKRIARLPRKRIFKFRDLVDELLRAGRYTELILLLERHLVWLVRIYQTDFLLPRARKRLTQSPWFTELERRTNQRRKRLLLKRVTDLLDPLARRFGALLPSYERESGAAQEAIRHVLLSHDMVKALARYRPYFALKVLQFPVDERFDFLDLYLRFLLSDPSSVLYYEIHNNQNLSSGYRYRIPESNKLLHYFFADATVAEKLSVWSPIGEAVLAELDRLARDPVVDPYNHAMSDFRENGCWQSPFFVAIRFFDIMVSEALYQGITWHMWLYYLPHFTQRIVRNYTINDPSVDLYAEWPTKYSYLLYEMISTLCHWIEAAKDVPANQANVVLESLTADHENGNIPKSSIIALSQCLRLIVESSKIEERFQQYLLNIVFRLYFDLRKEPKLQEYARVLRTALREGGAYERPNDETYRERLVAAFKRHDTIPYQRSHVEELCGALR